MVKTPEHQAAIAGGLCHFAGLPRVELDGDSAVAISYLQVITPNREAKPVELSGHGLSSGYRIHRLGANRWDLKRTQGRLEGDPARLPHARRQRGRARIAAAGGGEMKSPAGHQLANG